LKNRLTSTAKLLKQGGIDKSFAHDILNIVYNLASKQPIRKSHITKTIKKYYNK